MLEQDKEFEDLMRFRSLLILEEQEIRDKGRLLKEIKRNLLSDNYLRIYERALVGRCAYVKPYPISDVRDFEFGFSRVFMCASSRSSLSFYVDQDVNPALYNESFSSTHPYYNVYILAGMRFAPIYEFLRDYMHEYRKDV